MLSSSSSEQATALFSRGHLRELEDVEQGLEGSLRSEDEDDDAYNAAGGEDETESTYDILIQDGPFEVATCPSRSCLEPWKDDARTSGVRGGSKFQGAAHQPINASKLAFEPGRDLMAPTPFVSWVYQFIRQVLSARTRFSFFLMKTISANRSGRDGYTATALFPIPFPFEDAFRVGPDLRSKKRRQLDAMRKLLHLVIMALNYEHFKKPLTILQLIRRRPSAMHMQVYERLWAFIKASGPPAMVSIAGCGRKSFQLGARFNELEKALDKIGLNPGSFYDRSGVGTDVPADNDAADELRPYRPLDASRIRLTGTGSWNCLGYLSDLLYMPYVEPNINRFNVVPQEGQYPDVRGGDVDQVWQLTKVWDVKNLLKLIPKSLGPADDELHLHTRVFGNFKNKDADRQIGDRRGRNFTEGRIFPGPSHDIPNATALLQLEVERFSEVLVGGIADRRDFYHQFAVTSERAASNTIYPAFRVEDFKGTQAYDEFLRSFGTRHSHDREKSGDFLGQPKPLLVASRADSEVYAAFGALYQGDHLGVEFACCAHEMMLEEAGCHPRDNRLRASAAILHNKPTTGLVIDDFFCISSEDVCLATDTKFAGKSRSAEFMEKAKAAYEKEGVIGSDDKEVSSSLLFKVIGAEVNSSVSSVQRGLVSLGAPAEKRFGLMMISAMVANMPFTSDALHATLLGSWISTILYRRPMMAHVNSLFQVIPADELETTSSTTRHLSRKAADELLVLSCLGVVAASNLAVPFSERIYASDASTEKGGLVSSEIATRLSRTLWRTAARSAKNPKLESRTAALHRIRDSFFEDEIDVEEGKEDALSSRVERPVGLRFDFIELCGGAGVVTKEMIRLGCICGPVFDISYSQRYDITDRRVFQWIAFMCEQGRLKSFLTAPPCTTFSPAAFPALRSFKKPLGFNPRHPRVLHGNDMAFSSIGSMMIAKRTKVFGLMETPRRSKLRWTPHWKAMRSLGADEVHLASCQYGSPHMKEFALMTVNMNARCLAKRCSRDDKHVVIQGKFTKPSATYTEGLAVAIAKVFASHLRHRARHEIDHDLKTAGLEDVLTNEVLLTQKWKVEASWKWKGSCHINILETAAALRAFEAEAIRGGDSRFVDLIDSNVALCALSRGRSSSAALKHMLKRASTLSIAYGLYHAGRFAPTRWNPADHPTRDTDVPEPLAVSFSSCSDAEARWLASLSGLRRWSSNWLRLSILLCPSWISFFVDPSCSKRLGPLLDLDPPLLMDFDSTLGFPGEGPGSCQLVSWTFLLITFGVAGAVASHGGALRREQRKGLELPEGRRVTEATRSVRATLVSAFNRWLWEAGLAYDDIFQANPPDFDRINSVLTQYGRFLFSEGKPYYHFAETINAVSARRPTLRRSLQQAWGLCAMWTSFEPVEHHRAMPFQVLLAVLSTCLIWGWTREAAIFAMCWGMLLRIGELMTARRADIIFPQDVRYSIDYVLIKILEPKTRFRAARHQSSKLEPPDLIAVAWMGLGHLKHHERIWPSSPSTLRSRLDKVLLKLGLPIRTVNMQKPLTLASFRPGGATYLIGLTESSELVRRRGRWISLKVMDIYLQEVAASTFMTDLDPSARTTILTAMEQFPSVLQMSVRFFNSHFPETAWNLLFKHGPFSVDPTGQLGKMGFEWPPEWLPTSTQYRNVG